jgi:hypothetical protein
VARGRELEWRGVVGVKQEEEEARKRDQKEIESKTQRYGPGVDRKSLVIDRARTGARRARPRFALKK